MIYLLDCVDRLHVALVYIRSSCIRVFLSNVVDFDTTPFQDQGLTIGVISVRSGLLDGTASVSIGASSSPLC